LDTFKFYVNHEQSVNQDSDRLRRVYNLNERYILYSFISTMYIHQIQDLLQKVFWFYRSESRKRYKFNLYL